MQTYTVIIKDLSAIDSNTEFKATLENIKTSNQLITKLQELIFDYAQDLDTDPEMIRILLVRREK